MKLTFSDVIAGCAVSSRAPFSGLPENSPLNKLPCDGSGSDEFGGGIVFRVLGLSRFLASPALASSPVSLFSMGDKPSVSGTDALLEATVS